MDEELSVGLAAAAGVAIENARLHNRVQELAVVEDRERIARDLHDTVIQRLFGEGLKLLSTMNVVDERAQVRIQSTIDGLDQTIKELRQAVFSLQGGETSAPGGLRGQLLTELNGAREALGFEPRLQFDGPVESISSRISEHLLPVVREALSNIAKHARARNVRVALKVDDHVTLVVSDDGVGVPDEVLGGHGLANIVDRAQRLGGEASIHNQPDGGSLLTWRVPLEPSAVRHPSSATR